jgi:ribonucleoside-diphosphate reductase alpha chain
LESWKKGLKGVTVYVDGSRDGVLIAKSKTEKVDGRPLDIEVVMAPKRPAELICDIKKVKVQGEGWTIFVGLLNNKPYEIFGGLSKHIDIPNRCKIGKLIKNGKVDGLSTYNLVVGEVDDQMIIKDIVNVFENANFGSFTRTISLALRHGTPVQYVVEQLQKDKHSDMTSFSKVVARVLKSYIRDGTKSTDDKTCTVCKKENSIIYQEGCLVCSSCGYSRCS